MNFRRLAAVALASAACAAASPPSLAGQGVTTGSISATVTDANGTPRPDVTVVATHVPSGTTYGGRTRADGRVTIPGMRVGGPYRVTASLIGYQAQVVEDIQVNLGVTSDLRFVMREVALRLDAVQVTAEADAIISSERTGAATSVSRETLNTLPTITRRIEDFARLTPQYSGGPFGFSFAGQDNRLNNLTVDGSYFNNSFGLSGQPGDRTGVAPISLDAIEQVQINIAPYDVRQGNFVGAGINTVTRSGTNRFAGSVYHQRRDQGLVGTRAGDLNFDPGTFEYRQFGGWLAGPILQNRAFFFVSFEDDALTEPGTTWLANTGSQTVEGTITRVRVGSLDSISNFLQTNFGYATGGYQGYDHSTPARRFLPKLDINLNERNKLSLRYVHLDSETDVLLSNSGSLGGPNNPANRRTNPNALNFQNSNYIIQENIRSLVGELNSIVGANMSNNLIIGYTHHDESRASRGTMFPFVDINEQGSVYTSFGFEPFTPNNELRYSSIQLQNNFTRFGERHTLTFGVSAERYESENVFFPGSQSVYVYNSLADFYTDLNDHIANPNRITSPITLRRFQVRWMNIPGMDKPVQPLEVLFAGAYAQNEWQVNPTLRLTAGLRIDAPFFGETGYRNANADALTFRDEHGNAVQYETAKLPDANPLFSPRLGLNWDLFGNRTTQIRGGTGIFTGRPAYVWISNQIGNTGVLTGFAELNNTTARPFHPDPNHYKPTQVDGSPATSYELALTDPDFRFPQLWRSNIAVDQRLPMGLIGTAELLYSRDINGIYYINANLPAAQAQFSGADDRPRWTSNRINNVVGNQVSTAIVLKNQNVGYSYNLAGSLERPFASGLFAKVAYSYGVARNTVDPGSIAGGSWSGNAHAGDPNNPGVGFSSNSPGHRFFTALSYRREYFRMGATSLALFWEGRSGPTFSYTFAGDLNGDGAGNDLIYVHRDQSEMNFQTYTASGVTYTAAQQAAAWDAFIEQDRYLRTRRGQYAERNAARLPAIYRADLSVTQDLFTDLRGSRNSLQLRVDIMNVTNLLNDEWGLSQRAVHTQPLIVPTAAQGGPVGVGGIAQYRMRAINNELMSRSLQQNVGINDVYRVQFGLRYTFN